MPAPKRVRAKEPAKSISWDSPEEQPFGEEIDRLERAKRRDKFAAAAITGMLATESRRRPDSLARSAREYADAMIAELDESEGNA